jgi:hypothetical protein
MNPDMISPVTHLWTLPPSTICVTAYSVMFNSVAVQLQSGEAGFQCIKIGTLSSMLAKQPTTAHCYHPREGM